MVVSGAHVESMLMAGAAGDCVGFAWEGRPGPEEREMFPERWRVSDDTILTLATCEGIVAAGRVTAESIARALADSFRSRRIPGLGASTLRALRALESGSHWAMAGRSGEHAAGNGAAMRIAPLALFLSGSPRSPARSRGPPARRFRRDGRIGSRSRRRSDGFPERSST